MVGFVRPAVGTDRTGIGTVVGRHRLQRLAIQVVSLQEPPQGRVARDRTADSRRSDHLAWLKPLGKVVIGMAVGFPVGIKQRERPGGGLDTDHVPGVVGDQVVRPSGTGPGRRSRDGIGQVRCGQHLADDHRVQLARLAVVAREVVDVDAQAVLVEPRQAHHSRQRVDQLRGTVVGADP